MTTRLIVLLVGLAVATGFATLARPVRAQQAKEAKLTIAVIDIQEIRRASIAMKGVRAQIEAELKKFQAEAQAEERKLRVALEQLRRQRSVLTPQALLRRRRAWQARAAAVQRRFKVRRRRFDQGYAQARRQFLAVVLEVVAEIAKEKGYDLVINRRQVAYARNSMVITKDVLKRLDKRLPVIKLKLPAATKPRPRRRTRPRTRPRPQPAPRLSIPKVMAPK